MSKVVKAKYTAEAVAGFNHRTAMEEAARRRNEAASGNPPPSSNDDVQGKKDESQSIPASVHKSAVFIPGLSVIEKAIEILKNHFFKQHL